jgi:epoxyqueuosine reductase
MNTVEKKRRAEASSKSVEIKRRATALRFDATGIALLESNAHAAELERWLAAGHAGTMTYLQRQAEKRKDPRTIMPGAMTAVVTLTNYFHGSANPGRQPGEKTSGDGRVLNPGLPPGVSNARVAQYAWSPDYHEVLGERLEQLAASIREIVPGSTTRCYVDAGPVPERELAQLAGLGWIGKNMMLIHPEIGSFTFIGVVLTDADLAPDLPFEADRCGTCTRCLDACPTHAFVGPRDLDARACISYLTIEHRGEFSDTQRAQVGEWVFGCDVCQDVCPWNVSFARETADPGFAMRPEVAAPDVQALATMEDSEFERRYGESPFTRPGGAGMRRNAAAVLLSPRPPLHDVERGSDV